MAIIGKIRKRGGIAVAIVAIAILAFIFSDLLTRNGDSRPSKIASINGIDINFNEFDEATTTIENNMKQQTKTNALNQEQSFQAKQQAFQQLVSEKLLNQECDKLGITVGEDEMNDMFFGTFIPQIVRQNFTDPKTGQYNAQAIKQYIAQFDKLPQEEQTNWKNFENYVRKERLQEKYERLLNKSFYMPKAIAKHMSDTYDQVTDSRYVCLPYSSIADNQIKVTEEDYKKYYEEHKNEYRITDELRDVEFVKFDVQPSPTDITKINDSVASVFSQLQTTANNEMASFVSISSDEKYDSNYYTRDAIKNIFPDSIIAGKGAGSFIAPRQVGKSWVMGKITDIQDRPDSVRFARILILNNTASNEIKRTPAQDKKLTDSLFNMFKTNPALFEANVAKCSDDPNAKNNFGDEGWMMDGQLQGDLFSQICSTPVNGIFVYNLPNGVGHFIIKVKDKTQAKNKLQLATIVIGIRASDKTINDTRDKANIFLSKVKNLSDLTSQAQKQNLNVLTSTVNEMAYQLDGTPYAREVIRWAFNKKTSKGDAAPEIYEVQDMFLVVGLKDIKKKGILPLEQVKPYIEAQVKIEKKAEKLMAKANTILKTAKTIDEFVLKAGGVVDTAMGIDFSSPYFVKAGAEMRVIGTLSAVRNIGMQKPIKGFNGVYVVQVDRISKRPQKEDYRMICQQYNMLSNQRTAQLRQPITVLISKAKMKNNFSFFY